MSEKELYLNKLKELKDMLEDEILNRKLEIIEMEVEKDKLKKEFNINQFILFDYYTMEIEKDKYKKEINNKNYWITNMEDKIRKVKMEIIELENKYNDILTKIYSCKLEKIG